MTALIISSSTNQLKVFVLFTVVLIIVVAGKETTTLNERCNDSIDDHHEQEQQNNIEHRYLAKYTVIDDSSIGELLEQLKNITTEPASSLAKSKYKITSTATAMVVTARLILVILICVLLVKLRAPKSARGARAAAAGLPAGCSKYESQAQSQSDDNNGNNDSNNRLPTDEHLLLERATLIEHLGEQESKLYKIFRKLFNYTHITNDTNQNSQSKSASYDDHQSYEARMKRTSSQPELSSQRSSSHNAARTARRRHSDITPPSHLKLPPGPMGLPFLGYLPFVSNEIHLTLTSLSERYGPIYQIFLGGIRVVVLNDASLVRQAFKQPVFSGRPDTQLTRILQGYGIVNSEGALWKEQRAFIHTALRKLGAKSLMNGSNGLEAKIQNQVKEFVSDLSVHASEGKPCQVRPIVARAVSSVVGSIVMNLTYRKYEEKEKFDRLIELMQEGFRLFTIAMPLDFIPIFRFLPGVSYAYKKMKKNRAETSAFFQGVADEHRKYLSKTFNLGTQSSASSLHPRTGDGQFGGNGSSSNISSGQAAVPPPSQVQVNAAADSTTTTTTTTATTTGTTGNQEQLVSAAAAAANELQVSKPGCCSCSATDRQGHPADLPGAREIICNHHHHQRRRLHHHNQQEQLVANEKASSCSSACSQNQQQAAPFVDGSSKPLSTSSTNKQHVELENIVARDLVDAYIVQQKKHEKDGKENYFSDQQLVQIMSDIFSAGLETVTSTIEWSILFLILNTHCQEQIQNEIDQVIGRERSPQLDDLSHMPYTEATIYEVLRRSNVVALGNAHATLDDASIGGYRIPKGTQVLPNLYGIHMNPKLWNQPDKFDPSRFIVNERAQKPDYFIPFSVGRRMCLGDVLAKMEVFLFLVGLLQKYDLSVADEDRLNPPQVKGTIGVSNTPASFRVALHNRLVPPTKCFESATPRTRTPTTGSDTSPPPTSDQEDVVLPMTAD